MERRDDRHEHEPAPARPPTPGEKVTPDPEGKAPELEGSVVGAGAGAALGMVGGPVGMVVGALAGAAGGWWAIDKLTEEMGTYGDEEDRWCRAHYERQENLLADRAYDEVRPAYVYGHLAARNPALAGRPFADIEEELRRDWDAGLSARHGEWAKARPYAQAAYERRLKQ